MNQQTKQFVIDQTKGMDNEQAAKRIQRLVNCGIKQARKLVEEAKGTES